MNHTMNVTTLPKTLEAGSNASAYTYNAASHVDLCLFACHYLTYALPLMRELRDSSSDDLEKMELSASCKNMQNLLVLSLSVNAFAASSVFYNKKYWDKLLQNCCKAK